jgi:hypothetical protein
MYIAEALKSGANVINTPVDQDRVQYPTNHPPTPLDHYLWHHAQMTEIFNLKIISFISCQY